MIKKIIKARIRPKKRQPSSAQKRKKKKDPVTDFIPKKSKRTGNIKVTGDGETWVEHIITSKKTTAARSYFKSNHTKKCVWDEPPSGATKIILFRE